MTVPEAANSTRRASVVVAATRIEAVVPRASAICEATVRCQISS